MIRFTLLAVGLLTASVLVAPVHASDGYPHGDCSGQLVQIGSGDATPFATIYYVITGDTPNQGWGYLEANDIAGLQRGYFNNAPGLFNISDICVETDHPDLMWY